MRFFWSWEQIGYFRGIKGANTNWHNLSLCFSLGHFFSWIYSLWNIVSSLRIFFWKQLVYPLIFFGGCISTVWHACFQFCIALPVTFLLGLKAVNSLAWWSDPQHILHSFLNLTDSCMLAYFNFCDVRTTTDSFYVKNVEYCSLTAAL